MNRSHAQRKLDILVGTGQPLADNHGTVATATTVAKVGSVGVVAPTAIVTVTQPADGVPRDDHAGSAPSVYQQLCSCV